MQRRKGIKRSRLRRRGRRTIEWEQARQELKDEFLTRGIVFCELAMDGCTGGNCLGFAHAVKRRYITRNAEIGSPYHLKTVVLACNSCHDRIERQPSAVMRQIVMETIGQREWVLSERRKKDDRGDEKETAAPAIR